jgi:hypothetical protein
MKKQDILKKGIFLKRGLVNNMVKDVLIYWICEEYKVVFSLPYLKGSTCPKCKSHFNVESLSDDSEEIYKIGLKIGKRVGAKEELEKNNFANDHNLKLIKAQSKRIKELEKRLKELKA